jgi:hypothetical protein
MPTSGEWRGHRDGACRVRPWGRGRHRVRPTRLQRLRHGAEKNDHTSASTRHADGDAAEAERHRTRGLHPEARLDDDVFEVPAPPPPPPPPTQPVPEEALIRAVRAVLSQQPSIVAQHPATPAPTLSPLAALDKEDANMARIFRAVGQGIHGEIKSTWTISEGLDVRPDSSGKSDTKRTVPFRRVTRRRKNACSS